MTTGTSSTKSIQLGFCVPIENSEQLINVAHRNPDYSQWDGGQVGGIPVWLDPQHLFREPLICQAEGCRRRRRPRAPTSSSSREQQNPLSSADSSLGEAEPMRFLCQVYAPVDCEDGSDRAYHRTIYVFGCPACPTANRGAIRVLRVQLTRINPYYPDNTTPSQHLLSDWDKHQPSTWNVFPCALCGLYAKGKCPIQQLYFCSPWHQKEYKKFIYDPQTKGDSLARPLLPTTTPPSIYAMFEMVVEEEEEDPEQVDGDDSTTDDNAPCLAQGDENDHDDPDEGIKKEEQDDNVDADQHLEQDDLNRMTGAQKNAVSQDAVTMQFYSRIQDRPGVQDQCLRYCRWPESTTSAAPLWIRQEGRLLSPEDVPNCAYCNSKRSFEFQLMPQMLTYLLKDRHHHTKKDDVVGEQELETLKQADFVLNEVAPIHIPPDLARLKKSAVQRVQDHLFRDQGDNLDWGVVAVYTCTNSCSGDSHDEVWGSYREEFAWKQTSLDVL